MQEQTYEHKDPPQNPKLGPQEASKGLKMTNFHGFQPPTPSGKAFLGGSGWIIACKAYIHYGHWLLCPDEPIKHLFMASGSLKNAQNRVKMANLHGFEPHTPSGRLFRCVSISGSSHVTQTQSAKYMYNFSFLTYFL